MNLADTRDAIADALDTVGDITMATRPVAAPRPLDGWVVISRLVPADFESCLATFTAVICLGPDEAKAEDLFETLGVAVIDAVTKSDSINVTDVTLQPEVIIAQGAVPGSLYVLALSLSTLVDSAAGDES